MYFSAQHYGILCKLFCPFGFGYSFIPILCLFGAYSLSMGGTHPTRDEDMATADRTSRSLTHSIALTYEIPEESLRGTLVGDVGRDIVNLVSSASNGQTSSAQADLTITNWRDRAVQLFHLDPATGQLRVASPPDREALCPASVGTTSDSQHSDLHLNLDEEKFIYANDEYNVVRNHMAELSPCYVDIKIAYAIRQTKSFSQGVTETHIVTDPDLITVRIRILDINDHKPVFQQSRVSSELGELSAIPEKTTIDLPTAFDPDAGENGTIGYWVVDRTAGSTSLERSFDSVSSKASESELAQTNIPFRLVGDPLRLVLTRNLDWESKREYDLLVYAKDYGRPQSLTGQLSVHVTVRDENDHVPQFGQSSYTAVINESVLRGTIILELTASDADSTTNGQLTFGLAPPTNSQERLAVQHFGIRTISPTQAAVYVIQTPDVDSTPKTTFSDRNLATSSGSTRVSEKLGKQFTFHVIVRDNGYPRQLSSRTEVTILVLDVNDMAPNIFVSYLNPSQSGDRQLGRLDFGRSPTPGERSYGQVKENSDRAFIAFVTVQDFDSGVWGQVRCYTNNDAFELMPVNEVTPGASISVGQFVGSLHQSTEITDRVTGEIGFKLLAVKPFDREKTEQISFHIVCVDNPQHTGSSLVNFANAVSSYYTSSQVGYASNNPIAGTVQLTGTALVRILVTDENDNEPVFSHAQYTFSIDEADGSVGRGNVLLATDSQLFVGRVSASDHDSTSQVVYSLPEDLLTLFRIESETGKIYTLHQFDREEIWRKVKQGEYPQSESLRAEVEHDKLVYLHFSVLCTDGLHNSTSKVRLLIRDVNDNPPVFTKSQYEFVVAENEQPIQSGSIGTVEAQDADADVNAQIVYQIYDATDQIPFIGKSAANQSTRTMRLSTNNLFTISAISGQLHLIRKLDREKQSHHIFYVLAIDNPGDGHVDRTWPTGNSPMDSKTQYRKSHTSTATVTVIVADVNDNAPTITYPPPHGVINVDSGAPAGHNLFTVVAHDPDAGDNGTVRFTLSTANFERGGKLQSDLEEHPNEAGVEMAGKSPSSSSSASSLSSFSTHMGTLSKSGLFSIDVTTGIVFLAEKITDQSANYLLVIGAHDLGRPQQRKTTTTVTVRAHNSQLLQALNTYRFGGHPGTPSDTRHPRGPSLLSDGTHPTGGAFGNLADIPRSFPDDVRPPPPIGRDASGVVGTETDLDSVDTSSMNAGGMRARFTSITDRTVVVVLATIFTLLLLTTVILVLLIKRRRDAESQRPTTRKSYDCPTSNNTVRPEQQQRPRLFNGPKAAPLSRLNQSSPGSHSCTMNSTGKTSDELATLPRLHPFILHETRARADELDHLEYGSPVYGKAGLYSGEMLTLIPSNGDYQQALSACLLDRPRIDLGSASGDSRLSSSTELLPNTAALTFGENVTLGRKPSGPMSHQVRTFCSPADVEFYQKQGFVLNDHKARNSKRYQTIDPLLGTFRTDRQEPTKAVQQMMINNNENQNNVLSANNTSALSPSALKHKDILINQPVGFTKLHQSSNPTSIYPVDVSCGLDSSMKIERQQETEASLDELAMQLKRINEMDELGGSRDKLNMSSNVCSRSILARKSISSSTNSHPSQSSSSISPPCDPNLVELNDGQCRSIRPASNLTADSGTGNHRTDILNGASMKHSPKNANSNANAASKGVSFV